VMESITKFLEKRLRLKVNKEKSAVGTGLWQKVSYPSGKTRKTCSM
jgi:hypothetical protein